MNTQYLIPFKDLQNTIGASPNFPMTPKQEAHWHKEYKFKVRGVTLKVERGDFGLCNCSMCTEILSDTAMELLAQLVKAELEQYDEIDRLVDEYKKSTPVDGDSLEDYMFKEQEDLLVTKFKVAYDEDLNKQKIKPGTVCYNRDTGEYATFISDVKKDTAPDGYNCIVAPNCTELPVPSNVFLRFARKVDLVQEY